MKRSISGLILLGFAVALPVTTAQAQKNMRQERVVINSAQIPNSQMPGVRLIRKGDSLLLAVKLINDSLDPNHRRDELRKTLANMLAAAKADKSIELSIVDTEGYVTEVNSIDQNVDILGSNKQRGMSHIDIRLKTAIPDQSIDGQALVKHLRGFVKSTETVGRTVVNATGKVDISILNPEQYRLDVIKLITTEIRAINDGLGQDYKVVLQGLERPLDWRRVGIVDVELYIPYKFLIIPGTITSLTGTGGGTLGR